jgi:charged multivesicular body protein 4
MNFLFGKKKPAPPAPSKAIDKLHETLVLLEKREAHLDKQIGILKEQAKKYVQEKNKPRALTTLKKSKLLEKEFNSIGGQKLNIEAQISALTQAITNSETMAAMRLGKDTLAGMESKVDPDKVAETMDNISESMARMEEVTDAMARPLGPVTDDDELLQELDSLSLQEELLRKPELPVICKEPELVLPSVPMEKKKEEEDLELRELQVLMNA